MALLGKVRGRATFTLAFGAWFVLLALWDVSDQYFGSYKRPVLPREYVSAWLFDTFGHWGPRVVVMATGILFVAGSFWLASVARKNKGPDDQRSGTRRFAVLSWTLILLVLALLAFIVVAPLFGNPTIDGLLSYWREWYYAPTAFLALVFVLGLSLRWDWEDFREKDDPWSLVRILAYLVLAIILLIFFLFLSWKAIVGTA